MLPVIRIEGETIADVWEKSVLAVWEKGVEIKTEYDRQQDPPSKDCTMIMVVKNPFSEPRIHLGFPGGFEDLEKYRQEIVNGVHDHWINPEEKMWTYTYHDRLFNYHLPRGINKNIFSQMRNFRIAFFKNESGHILCVTYRRFDPPLWTVENNLPEIFEWIIFK